MVRSRFVHRSMLSGTLTPILWHSRREAIAGYAQSNPQVKKILWIIILLKPMVYEFCLHRKIILFPNHVPTLGKMFSKDSRFGLPIKISSFAMNWILKHRSHLHPDSCRRIVGFSENQLWSLFYFT